MEEKYMYIINKTSKIGRVFPDNSPKGSDEGDEGFLYDFEDSHISDLASTFGISAMLGKNVLSLGDSGVCVEVIFTQKSGAEGKIEFEKYVKDFISITKEALPSMSKEYRDFYNHFVEDYEKNGLQMF